jgi:hypothetical protein
MQITLKACLSARETSHFLYGNGCLERELWRELCGERERAIGKRQKRKKRLEFILHVVFFVCQLVIVLYPFPVLPSKGGWGGLRALWQRTQETSRAKATFFIKRTTCLLTTRQP